MRCAGRNKQVVYYAIQTGVTTTIDEYGNETGESLTYSSPTELRCNVSAARSADTASVFGLDVSYDKAIIFSGRNTLGIDETTVFWVDRLPTNNAPYDYIAKRISVSLNYTAVALQRVDVSA